MIDSSKGGLRRSLRRGRRRGAVVAGLAETEELSVAAAAVAVAVRLVLGVVRGWIAYWTV